MGETFFKSKQVYYRSGIIFLFNWWHLQSVYLEPEKQQLLLRGKSVFSSQDLEVSSVPAPWGTASAPAIKTQQQLKGCAAHPAHHCCKFSV